MLCSLLYGCSELLEELDGLLNIRHRLGQAPMHTSPWEILFDIGYQPASNGLTACPKVLHDAHFVIQHSRSAKDSP